MFVIGGAAAGVAVAAGANTTIVAVLGGAAWVASLVAALILQGLWDVRAAHASWDRPGGGVVHPLNPDDYTRTLSKGSESRVDLLRPEREIVRFRGRSRELFVLESWCQSDPTVGVRLCAGLAGVGKTRLARKLATQLGSEWTCGTLRRGKADVAISVARVLRRPVLLVVDQAEAHSSLATFLAEAAEVRDFRLRVLLLARSSGEWWKDALADVQSPAVRDEMRRNVLELRQDAIDPTDQQQVFERALRAFALDLGVQPPSARLIVRRTTSPPVILQLHAAALEAVISRADSVPADSSIYNSLLDHEQRYWRGAALAAGFALDEAQCRQSVAMCTLLGAANPTECEDLIGQLPALRHTGVAHDVIRRWLQDLYPASDGSVVGALQPDALAERLVLQELSADPIVVDVLLERLTRTEQRRRVLSFLAGALDRGAEHAEDVLVRVLASDPRTLILDAMDVALSTPRPLSDPLAVTLRELEPDPAFDDVIDSMLDQSGRCELLPELAEVVCRRRLRTACARSVERQIAPLTAQLAERLWRLGRYEDAILKSTEAIPRLRELLASKAEDVDDEAEVRARLAGALSAHGIFLDMVSRSDKAVDCAAEAVMLYRTLVRQRPMDYQLDLADALDVFGVRLDERGRYEDSVEAMREAVGLYREMRADLSPERKSRFTTILSNFCNLLTRLDRYGEALIPAEEALALRRDLLEYQSDAARASLAHSLDTLGTVLGGLLREDEALALHKESVEIFRGLVRYRQVAYRADLAASLLLFGASQGGVDQYEDAAEAEGEAVVILRDLSHQRPDVHLPELARALSHHGVTLARLKRFDGALPRLAEAIRIFDDIEADGLSRYRAPFAVALEMYGAALGMIGKYRSAFHQLSRAIRIQRSLASVHPGTLESLAHSYDNAEVILEKLGRPRCAQAAHAMACDSRERRSLH